MFNEAFAIAFFRQELGKIATLKIGNYAKLYVWTPDRGVGTRGESTFHNSSFSHSACRHVQFRFSRFITSVFTNDWSWNCCPQSNGVTS